MSAPATRSRARSLATTTLAALMLSTIGLVFGGFSALGLPAAIAGTIVGAIAMRRHRGDRPWPLVAVLVGAVGIVLGAIVLIVTATVWLPVLLG